MHQWIVLFTAVMSGLIFGFGLILSGMVNPAIVLAFLDIAGTWNASLLWVMGGAVGISAVAFFIARRRSAGFLGLPVNVSTSRVIDKRLLAGSFLFGAGWGIAGFCPGPALVMAGAGSAKALLFVGAMLAGMTLFEIVGHGQKNSTAS
ncbi:MAG: YeeE/YedE family protein [Nitrosomonas sp.]|nr:YeeE/YedE family protein [Nitrosomonas sp.]